MDIQGKTAIVTGSCGGLGRAMIEYFAQKGAHCIVSDLQQENVNQTVEQLKKEGYTVDGFACDVSNEQSVIDFYEKVRELTGRIDIAVLNAGILRDGLLIRVDKETGKVKGKMTLDQWQSVINVNLTGVFLSGREAAHHMVELGGGVIIPIASIAMHGNPGQTNYSAAKAGVATMTKIWAQELSRYKIRVAGIAPGFIGTDMVLKDMKQEALEMWQKKIPIGRLGEPAEIANTAAFIVENELIDGVVIEASGGLTM